MTTLERLAETIEARRGADPETSWTARLLSQGPDVCARKFGEEAIETVIAATTRDRDGLTREAADALYHLLVLLAACDVPLPAVMDELERREGVSGVEEKASRQS